MILTDRLELFVVVFTVSANIVPACIIAVLALLELDPFYAIETVMIKANISASYLIALKVYRFIWLALALVCFAAPCKSMFVLMETQVIPFFYIISAMGRMTLSSSSTFLFRQMQLLQCLLHDVEEIGTGSVLAIVFLGVVFLANDALVSFQQRHFSAFFVTVLLLALFIIVGGVIMVVSCSIYENTSQALVHWKKDLIHFQRDGKYQKRCFCSLRALAIPAGNVGIMDKDIKANYSLSLWSWTLNLMVFIRQLSRDNSFSSTIPG